MPPSEAPRIDDFSPRTLPSGLLVVNGTATPYHAVRLVGHGLEGVAGVQVSLRAWPSCSSSGGGSTTGIAAMSVIVGDAQVVEARFPAVPFGAYAVCVFSSVFANAGGEFERVGTSPLLVGTCVCGILPCGVLAFRVSFFFFLFSIAYACSVESECGMC